MVRFFFLYPHHFIRLIFYEGVDLGVHLFCEVFDLVFVSFVLVFGNGFGGELGFTLVHRFLSDFSDICFGFFAHCFYLFSDLVSSFLGEGGDADEEEISLVIYAYSQVGFVDGVGDVFAVAFVSRLDFDGGVIGDGDEGDGVHFHRSVVGFDVDIFDQTGGGASDLQALEFFFEVSEGFLHLLVVGGEVHREGRKKDKDSRL